MAYTFTTDVSEEEIIGYLNSIPHYNAMQSPAWAKVKNGWNSTFCAAKDENGNICGCALLLIRKLPLGFKIVYSPRGFVIDYSNTELVKTFTEGAVAYCKKIGAYILRIDPEIIIGSRTSDIKADNNREGHSQMQTLLDCGFSHMGFDPGFHEYTQPRFYAEYKLTDNEGKILSDEEILSGFDKKLKKFIGAYTEKRGIFFEADNSENVIDRYIKISEHTENRQHILLRDKEYFRRMRDAYGDKCTVLFGSIDLDKFEAFLATQPDNDQTRADREESKRIRAEKGNIVDMSAVFFIQSKDTAYLMYSGFDDSVFNRFRTTNQIRYEAMRYFRDKGITTFSFMGIHGLLEDSLSQFKLKFNPTVVEFAGEFEYPVKPVTYKFMQKALPAAKRIYINIMLRLKGKK